MSAAQVLVEEPVSTGVTQTLVPQNTPPKNEQNTDHEGLVTVGIAIVISLTITIMVLGAILIALSLRGSGVMGVL